jgi:hypothetical protein
MVPKLILGGSISAAAQYVLQPEGHRGTDLAALGRTAEYAFRDHDGDRVAAIASHNLAASATDRNSADAAWSRPPPMPTR